MCGLKAAQTNWPAAFAAGEMFCAAFRPHISFNLPFWNKISHHFFYTRNPGVKKWELILFLKEVKKNCAA